MTRSLAKLVALVLAVVLLGAVPGLVGCGGNGGGGKAEIRIGILTDFTGPACFAVKPCLDAFIDCVKLAEADGTLGDADVKFVTYDQKTDYARTPAGYKWLKGQGVVAMNIISPTDRSILRNNFAEDSMPVIGSSLDEESLAHPWTFSYCGSNGHEMEILLQWIMDTWDYAGEGRPPKIGHNTWSLSSGVFHQLGIDRMLEWYPDKFDFVGVKMAPTSQTTWAAEVAYFKDCDYIIITTSGNMTTTFIREARDRGYNKALLGCQDSFPGYWDLVVSAVSPEKLHDCYMEVWHRWWYEDCEFIRLAKETVTTYHADEADALMRSSGPLGGVVMGMMTVDALKRAIEAVGAENVDGDAIREAFMATNLTVDGFPYPFKYTDRDHAAVHEMRVFKYNPSINNWEGVSDFITARSLQD